MRDTDAVLDLGSGSGKVCYIAAQVVGLLGSRAALNYMIVSDAGKPFEMDDLLQVVARFTDPRPPILQREEP